jgi:tocopherol cyclase
VLLHRVMKTWQPAAYQGKSRMRGYFEGWYYKLVDRDERNVVAIIPGVSFGATPADSHCFIQFIGESANTSHYYKIDIGEFSFSRDGREISIGRSRFTPESAYLDVADADGGITGTLEFADIKPWPVTVVSPGAMGWYAFVPRMECYHAVVSFDHGILGNLQVRGKKIDYTGGRGYSEKDWGRSFPSYHIWLQTNHFDQAGTSLMVSVANVPWLGRSFDGFLIGFWHNGHLHRFTTYTGARIFDCRYANGKLNIGVESGQGALEVEVSNQTGSDLRTPVTGEMKGRLSESIKAETRIRFASKVGTRREAFEGIGRHTGLEIEGDVPEVLRQQKRWTWKSGGT